jgi:hypothetical protein
MPGNDQYSLPNSDTYLNQQTLRVDAALPAAGAWDAAPLERQTAAFDTLTLLCKYDAPANSDGGAFDLLIEISMDGVAWYQTTIFAGGAVAGALDVMSRFQREFLRYAATGLTAEMMAYGPIEIAGVADYIRVFARESGDIVHPGTLEILGSWK